ncbi:unnamed protein product [Rhodiola kirilowii]
MGKKSSIAWNQVCQNKFDGGLGIKNLGLFDVALNLSQFWNICKKKHSGWVKLLHNYYFSNVNVWDMVEKNHYSWQVKKILRLRSMAEKCVTVTQGGVLSWKGVDNCFQWKGSYDLLKGDIQEKLWAELVWADLSPPKHNFCAWLAIQNKIQTRDRLVLEGDIDRRCCWCRHHPESHEHIFFKCSSMHVLKPLFDVAGSSIHWESWDDVMEWRTQRIWKSKEEKEITSFIINAAIYEIWSNRNSTIFSNIKLLS